MRFELLENRELLTVDLVVTGSNPGIISTHDGYSEVSFRVENGGSDVAGDVEVAVQLVLDGTPTEAVHHWELGDVEPSEAVRVSGAQLDIPFIIHQESQVTFRISVTSSNPDTDATDNVFESNVDQLGLLVSCQSRYRGDMDLDNGIDIVDFVSFALNFGKTDATLADGDLDCNGTVDFADYLILANNFGSKPRHGFG